MKPWMLSLQLVRARRRAGLSQSAVAARMGTTQSAVSRAEAGRTLPSVSFLDRYARALGEPLSITFGADPEVPDADEIRARARRVLGDHVFDPWRRDPTPEEARTLEADGLTRERFRG